MIIIAIETGSVGRAYSEYIASVVGSRPEITGKIVSTVRAIERGSKTTWAGEKNKTTTTTQPDAFSQNNKRLSDITYKPSPGEAATRKLFKLAYNVFVITFNF